MKKLLPAMVFFFLSASASQAQLMSNTTLTTVAMNGGVYLKVDSVANKLAADSVAYVKIEIGSIVNGQFTPANPAMERTVNNLTFTNNSAPVSLTFTTAMAAGTYSTKVQMYKNNFFGTPKPYGTEGYGTVTIP